jgi:hypothetical protein
VGLWPRSGVRDTLHTGGPLTRVPDLSTPSSRLREIREALLRLHQALLDWQRRAHERVHGRLSATELLQVVLHDAEFAWLRPLSEGVARIDAMLAEDGPPDEDAILVQVRAIASPDADGTPYGQRYLQAIQESPDAVLAHRDLLALIRRSRNPR